jgi:hypothetical protein
MGSDVLGHGRGLPHTDALDGRDGSEIGNVGVARARCIAVVEGDGRNDVGPHGVHVDEIAGCQRHRCCDDQGTVGVDRKGHRKPRGPILDGVGNLWVYGHETEQVADVRLEAQANHRQQVLAEL